MPINFSNWNKQFLKEKKDFSKVNEDATCLLTLNQKKMTMEEYSPYSSTISSTSTITSSATTLKPQPSSISSNHQQHNHNHHHHHHHYQQRPLKSIKQQQERNEFIKEKKSRNDYTGLFPAEIGTDYSFKREIVWKNAIGFLALHLAALYGLWLMMVKCMWSTDIWASIVALSSGIGVTTGAHRLFSHKAYKATFITRLVLIAFHTLAGQNCLYVWARDHRQHHKYTDTDADPHNANRGFFFSHVGWLMSRKHPAVISKGKTIDMSDLEADWLIMYQKKHYKVLYTIFAILMPSLVPVLCWGESFFNSFFAAYMFRSVLVLNITWLVNSAAHIYGNKPFDKYMKPVESHFVAFVSVGEGWHNYHHAFPWDYRAAELGAKYSISTMVIDVLAFFGFAYDLRTTPYHMVKNRVERTGDGSHPIFGKQATKLEKTGKLEDTDIVEILKTSETGMKRSVAAQG